MVRRLCVVAVLAGVGLTAGAVQGQAPAPTGQTREQAAAAAASAAASVPLKVTVAIVRQQGTKQTGRLPFELWVNTGSDATLRLNSDVAVPSITFATDASGKATPTTSFQMRTLGTSLTCNARDLGDGRFRLDIAIDDSQMLPVPAGAAGDPVRPSFQNFRATTYVILRDGQTVQHSVGTDKVSGEVVKVEITAQVIK